MDNREFDLPTSSSDWNEDEEPQTWTFEDEEDLHLFLDEVEDIFDLTMKLYHYNSVPSFVEFYDKFKDSGLARLRDYYDVHTEEKTSTKRLSCVGLSYLFKEELSKVLSTTRFSGTSRCLYFASSSLVPNHKIPSIISSEESLCPAELTEHVTVTIKFQIAGRKGHVIMDFGYGLDIPIVVMEDGMQPQSETFRRLSRTGFRTHYFEHLTSNFVLWTVKEDSVNLFRLFYLKRQFNRLDLTEKRHKVNPLQAAVIYVESKPAACYYSSLDNRPPCIKAFNNEDGIINRVTIPCTDVLDGGNAVLDRVLTRLGPNARVEMEGLIRVALDEEYSRQLVELDRQCRDVLANIWNEDTPTPDYTKV